MKNWSFKWLIKFKKTYKINEETIEIILINSKTGKGKPAEQFSRNTSYIFGVLWNLNS